MIIVKQLHVEYVVNNVKEYMESILNLNRDKNIIDSGYSVLHITEKEYIDNKELTVLKIVSRILKMKQSKNV